MLTDFFKGALGDGVISNGQPLRTEISSQMQSYPSYDKELNRSSSVAMLAIQRSLEQPSLTGIRPQVPLGSPPGTRLLGTDPRTKSRAPDLARHLKISLALGRDREVRAVAAHIKAEPPPYDVV